jgi:hypothetical protein
MKKKINTLEVGAINIQLQQYSGLTVRAIDINSQVPLSPTPVPSSQKTAIASFD